MLNLLKVINKNNEEKALLYDYETDTPYIILTGDYYHNKIDEQIEGFITALRFLKIDCEIKEIEINSNDPLFEICYFNRDDEENWEDL